MVSFSRENRDVKSFCAYVIILVSLLTAPLFELRPNRILSGEGVSACASMGGYFALLLVGVLVGMGFSLFGASFRWRYTVLLFNLAVFAMALGIGSQKILVHSGEAVRVSLGSAVWLVFLSQYVLFYSLCVAVPRRIKRIGLVAIPLSALAVYILMGGWDALSLLQEYRIRSGSISREFFRHLFIAATSAGIGSIGGIALGWLGNKQKLLTSPIEAFVNIVQTIPALAFLGLMMLPFGWLGSNSAWLKSIGVSGIGWAPAFTVLILYSLLPVTSNVMAGLRSLDKTILDNAAAVGMNYWQIAARVEIPLTMPIITEGIRTAMMQSIGNTLLAGLIGAGGLGAIIFLGLAQAAPDLVLLAALLSVGMAFVVDYLMRLLIAWMQRKAGGQR